MRKAFALATGDDQLSVPHGATDLKSNNMGSNPFMNMNVKLQKPNNKRSRATAAAGSSTRSSPCSKQKLAAANNTSKLGSASRSSSKYRGVTRHRWTGRYEAHLWDKNSWNQSQSKKGRQVYLGAYDNEDTAAHAYDLAALKYWGSGTILNFPVAMYDKEIEDMQRHTREEYIASLRRKSNGFSRGVSKYRGVARHHHNGRWEARIGRVYGNKYLYLGTYSTQEEAAIAYDIAALQYRGLNAVTNFDMSNYLRCMQPGQLITSDPSSLLKENDNSDSNNTAATSCSNEENHKGPIAPRAPYDNQVYPFDHSIRLYHQDPRTCTDCQIDHRGKNDIHNNMMIMQLENMLGTSNDHLNQLLQDQVSATCSVPPRIAHLQFSADASIASYNINNYSHQLTTPAKPPVLAAHAFDPAHLNSAYHLEKLMAEYKELLQSPKPKEMLEKAGTLSTIVDTLSDTASSSTTCSLSSTVQMTSNGYLNHIKPGGYVAGLLSPQEECIKYVDQIFDISDMVPGTTDSICSSNDLSSIQELVSCNNIAADIHCNNAIYPFPFNCVSSDGLMLDSSLSNYSLASSLHPTTFNSFHQQYLS